MIIAVIGCSFPTVTHLFCVCVLGDDMGASSVISFSCYKLSLCYQLLKIHYGSTSVLSVFQSLHFRSITVEIFNCIFLIEGRPAVLS